MFSKICFTALGLFATFFMLASAAPTRQQQKADDVAVVSNCVNTGQVALTFDDGPYIYDEGVTRYLGDSKVTFFLNGNNWACIYDRADELRALYAAGHTLGSHGWSHAHSDALTLDQINNELAKVEEAFIRILGVRPLYFRPPYGEYNDLLLSALSDRGYKKMFLWTDDIDDADLAPVNQSKNVYDQVASSYPAPHIILDHSTYNSTINDVVPYGVAELKERGYKLVSVDACMGGQGEWPYEWVGEPQNGNWQC